jgi:hypothetical protein
LAGFGEAAVSASAGTYFALETEKPWKLKRLSTNLQSIPALVGMIGGGVSSK